MSSDPQPSLANFIVNKEDVALLEGQLVAVGHLRVGKNGNDLLQVVDRLGRLDRPREPLVGEQVGRVGVEGDNVAEGVKRAPANEESAADAGDLEVVDAVLTEVGEDEAAGLPVALAYEVRALDHVLVEAFLGDRAVEASVVPRALRRRLGRYAHRLVADEQPVHLQLVAVVHGGWLNTLKKL